MKEMLKNALIKLPILNKFFGKIDSLKDKIIRLQIENEQLNTWVPPGHYYSPIPSIQEVKLNEKEIFSNITKEVPGVDLNEAEQLALFHKFKQYYKELPFEPHKKEGLRYFFENPAYSYSDAIFLYCMIRYAKPKKIVEVGSGYSSCLTLDTNELFFNNQISCSFIEPYPELLYSLIKYSDRDIIEVIAKKLQDVEIDKFSTLSAGDLLFIDSTHVSKVNSDVNYVFSKILPHIKPGVYIHFHDIFYPFEYPKEWIYEGRAWNECYMLKAFLQYNERFKIVFFNTFLEKYYEDMFLAEMPLCMRNLGGSIWIKKI